MNRERREGRIIVITRRGQGKENRGKKIESCFTKM
jgi:hypothetical protein